MATETANTQGPGPFYLFHYYPTDVYPQICITAFGVIAASVTFQNIYYRPYRWLFILTGESIAETVGCILRLICVKSISTGTYIAMNITLLTPPSSLMITNYIDVSEFIRLSDIHRSKNFWMRPNFVLKFFIYSGIMASVLQGTSSGMLSGRFVTKSRVLLVIGLCVQLAIFVLFSLVTISVARNDNYRYELTGLYAYTIRRRFMFVLFINIGLLSLRVVYRLAWYIDGFDGCISKAEWVFYIFDTLLVFLCFVIYIAGPFSHNFPKNAD